MSEFFLQIVNMCVSASWALLAVLILRFFIKKAPKWITMLLWGIVAVRLLCPISAARIIGGNPLAFGETGVKNRIQSVLRYQKPSFWVILAAILSCIIAGICCFKQY